jgi:hypothetical protein
MLYLDNVTLLAARQYIIGNNTSFVGLGNWSFATTVTNLTPGWHTFRVYAQLASTNATSAFVGGMPGAVTQGALNVLVLNK